MALQTGVSFFDEIGKGEIGKGVPRGGYVRAPLRQLVWLGRYVQKTHAVVPKHTAICLVPRGLGGRPNVELKAGIRARRALRGRKEVQQVENARSSERRGGGFFLSDALGVLFGPRVLFLRQTRLTLTCQQPECCFSVLAGAGLPLEAGYPPVAALGRVTLRGASVAGWGGGGYCPTGSVSRRFAASVGLATGSGNPVPDGSLLKGGGEELYPWKAAGKKESERHDARCCYLA